VTVPDELLAEYAAADEMRRGTLTKVSGDWGFPSYTYGLFIRKMEASGAGGRSSDLVGQLDRLEHQANHLKVPASYANMLYMLRNHIALVRERLTAHS